jgi:hypothetical protein
MKVSTSQTFQAFLKWLGQRLFRQPDETVPKPVAVGVRPPSERAGTTTRVVNRVVNRSKPDPAPVSLTTTVNGEITDGGPGKNVLVRRFVREDTGTHDTLKILDQSVLETDEASGIDPYNTGRFDRAKSWEARFRK